jgi:thiol:disulfide interchange protein DsbD
MLGWALLAGVSAVMLRTFDALAVDAGLLRIFGKGLGYLLALTSALWLLGVASGGRDVLQPLAHLSTRVQMGAAPLAGAPIGKINFIRVRNNAELDAILAQSTQPVMLDFYADWCIACQEMERLTFAAPAVAQRLSNMVLLQADVTENNVEDRAMLKRFRLFGPPGIIFFAPGGKEILDARVVGFQPAQRFSLALDRVLAD